MKNSEPPQQRLFVTGANGFIGRVFCSRASQHVVTACVRQSKNELPGIHQTLEIDNLSNKIQWGPMLEGMDCVVHLAARAHVIEEVSSNPLQLFREINRDATLHLARSAAEAGVKRFIYMSSIGVLGAKNVSGPFHHHSPFAPSEPYAISKMEAEIGLREISEETGLQVVSIRPPLVYGPGAIGNFRRLVRLVDRGLPLPLASMSGKKSLISVQNLSDLIVQCITAPVTGYLPLVVSDGSHWSTAELIRLIARYLGKSPRLLPFPVLLLETAASLLGKSKEVRKLAAPLEIDSGETSRILQWTPVQRPEDGLREAVESYISP